MKLVTAAIDSGINRIKKKIPHIIATSGHAVATIASYENGDAV